MNSAEQIVAHIVKAVFGPAAAPSRDLIRLAARRLASPPNCAAAASLAAFCQYFTNCYKNWNYNIEVNGERWLLERLAAFQPSIIFDVGSNVGDWLATALAVMPGSRFHAFEIIEETSAGLAARMGPHAQVVVNRCGLAERTGSLTMRVFEASSKLASHTAYPHGTYRELTCPVTRQTSAPARECSRGLLRARAPGRRFGGRPGRSGRA